MAGLMHKVKDALSGEKNTPEAEAANQGSSGTTMFAANFPIIVVLLEHLTNMSLQTMDTITPLLEEET